MKTATAFLAAVLLVGSFGTSGALAAAAGVISNTPGSYCHLTFPAIREDTLSWDRPVLKGASSGDVIDFYGSCDHDPLGKDEIASQRRQESERLDADFGD
jgi:hypothetical protein